MGYDPGSACPASGAMRSTVRHLPFGGHTVGSLLQRAEGVRVSGRGVSFTGSPYAVSGFTDGKTPALGGPAARRPTSDCPPTGRRRSRRIRRVKSILDGPRRGDRPIPQRGAVLRHHGAMSHSFAPLADSSDESAAPGVHTRRIHAKIREPVSSTARREIIGTWRVVKGIPGQRDR